MEWYKQIVGEYPIISAMIQFAILGTVGDWIAKVIQNKKIFWPFSVKETIWKFIEWAFLAVLIKAAFVGFKGFVDAMVDYGLLAEVFKTQGHFLRAFAISVVMNLQFGFLLVILHRILDYLPFGKTSWTGIHKGFYSLLWFWIPAHTVTFMLPNDFQIGLAAFWSVMLGLILGLFNRKPAA